MVKVEEALNAVVGAFPTTAKSYGSHDLVVILAYIDRFKATHEGIGGIRGWNGEGQVGSGLRAPNMPFYEHPHSIRRSMLLCLAKSGFITLKPKINEFEITPAGKEAAAKIYAAGFVWYRFVSGDCFSSLQGRGVVLLTDETAEARNKTNRNIQSFHSVYTRLEAEPIPI